MEKVEALKKPEERLEGKDYRPKIRSVTLHLMTGKMDGKQPATKPHMVKANTEELSREFRNLLRREFGDRWRARIGSTFKITIT